MWVLGTSAPGGGSLNCLRMLPLSPGALCPSTVSAAVEVFLLPLLHWLHTPKGLPASGLLSCLPSEWRTLLTGCSRSGCWCTLRGGRGALEGELSHQVSGKALWVWAVKRSCSYM